MSDQKISELTELISAHPITDVVPVVDTSVDETKKITLANLPMTESAVNFSYPYTVDIDGGVAQTRNLTTISSSNFSATVSSVYMGKNVNSIGNSTFSSFDNLTSVTIGNKVTSIGDTAFSACTSLASITIPDSVTSIGKGVFKDCSALTSIVIPDGATSIADETFFFCTGLTSAIIGDSVTEIGALAFSRCDSLTSITIPNSVTKITFLAFSSCGLTSATIGTGVTSIGNQAFKNCTSLTTINLRSMNRPNLGDNAFDNVAANATIHVPLGADYPSIFGGLPVSFDLTS